MYFYDVKLSSQFKETKYKDKLTLSITKTS